MRRQLIAWLIVILMVIKVFYSGYLFCHLGGYTLIDGDDCSMVIRGWRTATTPLVAFDSEMWLPLHPLLLALGFKLYPSPIITPALINILFSGATEIILFLLCFELFGASWVVFPAAILTALGAMFHPLHSRYGISGFEIPVFYFFVVLGVYCLSKYKNSLKKGHLLTASMAFLLATATRYEGWFLNVLFSLILLRKYFWKEKADRGTILSALSISYLFIAAWFCWEKIYFGDSLYFLWHRHKLDSNIPTLWNMLHFSSWNVFLDSLRIVVTDFHWPFFILSILGIGFALRQEKRRNYLGEYVLFVLIGWIFSMILPALRLDGFQVAKRFGIFFLLLLPIASFGLCQLVALPFKKRNYWLMPFAVLAIFCAWLLYQKIYWKRIYDLYVPLISADTRKVVDYLKSYKIGSQNKVLLELILETKEYLYEPYYIYALHPDYVLLDRRCKYVAKDLREYLDTTDNPSVLDLPPSELKEYMREHAINLIVTVRLSTQLKMADSFQKTATIGRYSLYALPRE